jgi:hypothetical protein
VQRSSKFDRADPLDVPADAGAYSHRAARRLPALQAMTLEERAAVAVATSLILRDQFRLACAKKRLLLERVKEKSHSHQPSMKHPLGPKQRQTE